MRWESLENNLGTISVIHQGRWKVSIQMVVMRKEEKEWLDSSHWRENSKGEEMTGFGEGLNVRILEKVVAMTCFLASGIQLAARYLSIPRIACGCRLKPGTVITAWSVCSNGASCGDLGEVSLEALPLHFQHPSDHLPLPFAVPFCFKQLFS